MYMVSMLIKMLINDLGDFLTYKRKLYVPQSIINTILREYHDVNGHFGQTHMQEMISKQFYWPQMIRNIGEYCNNCDTY